jgi:type IV pilus assembly protein PilY1
VGEKSLSKATIIGGVAYFSTFTPSDETAENACSLSGGMGALYAFHLHYGVKVYNNHKMNVGDRIPATPQMVFNSNADGESQFLLVGVGKGDNSGVIKAKSIDENAVPRDKDGDGVLDLVGEFAGFKTHRSYIYKDTQNKVH